MKFLNNCSTLPTREWLQMFFRETSLISQELAKAGSASLHVSWKHCMPLGHAFVHGGATSVFYDTYLMERRHSCEENVEKQEIPEI